MELQITLLKLTVLLHLSLHHSFLCHIACRFRYQNSWNILGSGCALWQSYILELFLQSVFSVCTHNGDTAFSIVMTNTECTGFNTSPIVSKFTKSLISKPLKKNKPLQHFIPNGAILMTLYCSLPPKRSLYIITCI